MLVWEYLEFLVLWLLSIKCKKAYHSFRSPSGSLDHCVDLRARVSGILRKHKSIKSNITREERAAISELKKDKSIKILPADKGKCTVVLDTDTYKSKCLDLLNDTKTYEKLKKDPTPKFKKELVAILKSLKDNDSIDEKVWRQIYPTTDTPPRFYGLPKIHKGHIPLRPIVSSIGSITYHCSKHLAEIISPPDWQDPPPYQELTRIQ